MSRVIASAGGCETPGGTLNFLLVAGSKGITIIRPRLALPRCQARPVSSCPAAPAGVRGPETACRNQVPQMQMKSVRRLFPGAFGKWRGRGPKSDVLIGPLPEVRLPTGSDDVLSPGSTGGDVHRISAVDIRAAAGEIPSPQTAKSASLSTGLCLMDLTSIQMTSIQIMVRAPVGTGGADDGEAVAVGSHIAAGQIAITNSTRKPL